MTDSVPRIGTLGVIELTKFIYELSNWFWIPDCTEHDTDLGDKLSGSYESRNDSTALGWGSDVVRLVRVAGWNVSDSKSGNCADIWLGFQLLWASAESRGGVHGLGVGFDR
jgi:hypothetical protein